MTPQERTAAETLLNLLSNDMRSPFADAGVVGDGDPTIAAANVHDLLHLVKQAGFLLGGAA